MVTSRSEEQTEILAIKHSNGKQATMMMEYGNNRKFAVILFQIYNEVNYDTTFVTKQ